MSVAYGLTDTEASTLAATLNAKRRRLGLGMRQVAEAAGVGLATISRAEAGDTRLERATVQRLRAWIQEEGEKGRAA